MKIGLDVAQTCVERAGCGWTAYSSAEAMVELDSVHEIELYHHFDRWINLDTKSGFQATGPKISSPTLEMTPEAGAEYWRALKAGELGSTTTVIHSFSYQSPKVPGTKLVVTIHDIAFWTHPEFCTEPNRIVCQRGVLEALKNADAFHFPSHFTKQEFERLLGGWLRESGKPWAVIPWGCRMKPVSELPTQSEPYWFFAGSLEPRKNIRTVLDALEKYWHEGGRTPLRIAGGAGWLSGDLRERIQALSSVGMVKHLGYVSESELIALYQGARGFLFPSWCEGFGLPVLEAMSQGCPVIASNVTSLPEVCGDAAILVSPGSIDDLVRAMNTLDSENRDARRLASLRQAAAFTWVQFAKEVIAFYERVAVS